MNRRSVPSILAVAVFGAVILALPAPRTAQAAVTCDTDATYQQCGRVFPDPQAGMATDPNAEGLLPAADFIQFGDPDLPGGSQIWNGLTFLQSRYDRYLEVWRLDELLDEEDALSSGLWRAGQRDRQPLIMARVTDESIPAAGKTRFVFGLSLHGIERAGAEGGTRALEDLVTYAYCESLGDLAAARADAICAKQTQVKIGEFEAGRGGFPARLLPWDADSLTMGEVLKRTELYFTYNNPDGWRRGDRVGGISHYQRYTGNGIDPNRDWPTVGYTFAPYSPGSEPETKYFAEALKARGGNWGSGIDLHGMGGAPVLTYTMLPAGQNDFRKNERIRAIAEQTQRDGLERLTWSDLIVPYGSPRRAVNVPVAGPVGQMYPQQWGTVWDTINYTTTGSYGDWMNSPLGLDSIGMDNEMALSHISNCGIGSCFIPEVEQLHVAGNKGLIYADIDTTLRTATTTYRFPFHGKGAYVRFDNVLENDGSSIGFAASGKLPAQEKITGMLPCATSCTSQELVFEGPADGVMNGGVTVNVAYAGPYTANDVVNAGLELQRYMVDPHDADGEGEWVTLARHFNQGNPYLTNSMTVAANMPAPGRYRIVLSDLTAPGPYTFEVLFDDDLTEADPGQLPYEVTQFDFFDDLNQYLPEENRFDALTAQAIIERPSVLDSYDVVALSADPLDGWDEQRPARSRLSKRDHDAYYRALTSYVRGGGTLVLLDGATQAAAEITGDRDLAASLIHEYAGWMGFTNANGSTYEDPLAKDVNVPGAAEGAGSRHQTYEPVPLGYSIDHAVPNQNGAAPIWGISDAAWDAAGGRTAARVQSQFTVLGEMPLGEGAIRIGGALLPPPTDQYDHPFGLSSYALTWTGWQLMENLFAVQAEDRPSPPKVLGRRQLPATGFSPGWVLLGLLMVPAALIARKLRNAYWV